MASPLAQRIVGILKMGLTPLLRSRGFRKEGSVYLARHGEMAFLVDIQKSRWNDEDEAQFTINGGIYIPGIVSAYSGRPDPEKPKIVDCCLSVSIGMLEKSRLDKWWKVTSRDSPQEVVDEEIARELCDRVENLLLPFLEKFESPADVAGFLCGTMDTPARFVAPQAPAQRHAYACLIYSKMGNSPKAQRAIEQALREAAGSPIEKVIKRRRDQVLSA